MGAKLSVLLAALALAACGSNGSSVSSGGAGSGAGGVTSASGGSSDSGGSSAGGAAGGTTSSASTGTSTAPLTVTGPLKVLFSMPLSGTLADQALVWGAAAQLAQSEINKVPLMKTLTLDIQDSQMTPATAVTMAQTSLDSSHASVYLTAEGTAAADAVLLATLPKPVITLASTASGQQLVTDDTTDSWFRTCDSVTLEGNAIARAALDKGATTMAILEGNNPYTLGCAAAAAAYFQQNGGTVTATVQFPYAPSPTYNYAADLATASAGSPDVIYLVPHPAVGITFLKAWTAAGTGKFAGQWYLNEDLSTSAIPTNVGVANVEGIRGVKPAGDDAANAIMLAAFTAAYGTTSGDPTIPRVASTYDAVYLMALAIAQAGTSTDVNAIRTALRSVANPPGTVVGPGQFAQAVALIQAGQDINYEGASGSCDFDVNGDVMPAMAEWQLEKGNFTILRTFSP
jgi:branched-chain amino acid transport system substrate-binding protein